MEEHRLKPMQPGYDEAVFNDFYKRTESLRKKLSRNIDARKFGVDTREILSWFDIKFIHVFNKYYGTKKNEYLLGDIINSLKLFSTRIMRASYTVKFSQTIVDLSDVEYGIPDEPVKNEFLFETAMEFFKKHLSENAYLLLESMITIPPFIRHKAELKGIKNLNKIPNSIYAEYFELGTSTKAIKYIEDLRKEITRATRKAREYYRENPIVSLNDRSISSSNLEIFSQVSTG